MKEKGKFYYYLVHYIPTVSLSLSLPLSLSSISFFLNSVNEDFHRSYMYKITHRNAETESHILKGWFSFFLSLTLHYSISLFAKLKKKTVLPETN